jgi:ABC-2 type transport system permease protein
VITRWAAIEFEALKFRRAGTVRVVSALLGFGLPVLAAALTSAAMSGEDSPLAVKARAMVIGTGWNGYLGVVGMMLSVALLLGAGFVICWCFGREFTDKTLASLFALPISRRRIAYAKFAVTLAWSLALCLLIVTVSLLAGLAIGLGPPGSAALGAAAKAFAAGTLTALLASPLAFVASIGRGYLAGIGALILLIVATQLVTSFGAGAWFPYAAPGLWMGLGGPGASEQISPVQLALAVPVFILGVVATGQWWKSAELDRH